MDVRGFDGQLHAQGQTWPPSNRGLQNRVRRIQASELNWVLNSIQFGLGNGFNEQLNHNEQGNGGHRYQLQGASTLETNHVLIPVQICPTNEFYEALNSNPQSQLLGSGVPIYVQQPMTSLYPFSETQTSYPRQFSTLSERGVITSTQDQVDQMQRREKKRKRTSTSLARIFHGYPAALKN